MLQDFKSVCDHFTTLRSKGLIQKSENLTIFQFYIKTKLRFDNILAFMYYY